jgi:hypothetical protein
MSQFHIINEDTEDTFASTNNLQDAIQVAREAARQGQAGELVSILEPGGKAVRQFVRMPDGSVAEQPIARQVKLSKGEVRLTQAEQVASVNCPREGRS